MDRVACRKRDLPPPDDPPVYEPCLICGSIYHIESSCDFESKSWASVSRTASPSCTSDAGSSTGSDCHVGDQPYSHDLGSHSEASTPFTSYSDQWHSSNPNTLETKWMEHKLSGSKLSRLLRSTSQAKRDPRRKPPMSKSSTPATPSDPDAYSPTLHEIKQEAYRTSNSGRALVNDTPEVIVKQEVIEGGASVHDVGEISEQSWEATNPQATSVPPECARNTECNSNDSCGNALPRGLLDPPTGSGSGGGHGQAPGNEPLDFEHVQGLYNLLLLFEATAKNLRDMLAPYLSLFAQHGFLLPGDQFLSSPFPFIHTPASLQPAPPPLPISDLELNYAPDPVFAQHNLPGMYNTIEGASSSTCNQDSYPVFPTMLLDTELDSLPTPPYPLFADTGPLPTTWNEDGNVLYSNFYSCGTGASDGIEPPLSLDDIVDVSAFCLPELPTACLGTAESTCDRPPLVHAISSQPLGTTGLPGVEALGNAPAIAHGDASSSLPHAIARTSSDSIPNSDTTQICSSALDAPSNVSSSRIPCDIEGCGKTFRRPYLLRDHKRAHHSGESNAHRCSFPGCIKSFGSQSNLTRHYKTHLKKIKSASARSSVERDTPVRRRRHSPNVPPTPRRYQILEPKTPGSVKDRLRKKVA